MATQEEMSRYFWSASTNCPPVLGRSILHSDWLTPYCLTIQHLYFYDSCVYEYVLQNIFQSKPFSRLHDLLSPRPVTKLKSRLTKQETSTTPGIFARENASSPFMMTCGILQKMLRTHI
jgi:hypothetical protein